MTKTITDHFNVWEATTTKALAAKAAARLGRERPKLAFVILPADSPNVSDRARAKAPDARYMVGAYDLPSERLRIPGLNAPRTR